MAYETIRLAVDERGRRRLTLNRPDMRNALNRPMVDDLHEALDALEARDDVRALILDAEGGKAFMSGADIAELRDRRRVDALKGINATLFARIEAFPAAHGRGDRRLVPRRRSRAGAGCDFRVAGASSRFGQPEVGLGHHGRGGRHPPPARARRARPGASAAVQRRPDRRRGGRGHRPRRSRRAGRRGAGGGRRAAGADPEAGARGRAADQGGAARLGARCRTRRTLRRLDNEIQADLFEHPDKFARMDAFLERRKPAEARLKPSRRASRSVEAGLS